MLNTIFSIFSSFFRMFDFTVDILSSFEKKNKTSIDLHCVHLFTDCCCQICQVAGEGL